MLEVSFTGRLQGSGAQVQTMTTDVNSPYKLILYKLPERRTLPARFTHAHLRRLSLSWISTACHRENNNWLSNKALVPYNHLEI